MNDDHFIEKLKVKDQLAWQEAYNRYYAKTEAYLHRIRYPADRLKEDAKDIWQETVIAFYIYLKKGNTPKDVGAYVYGIMRNLSLKRLKDRGREIPIEEDYIPEEDNSFERIKLIREIVMDVLTSMKGKRGLTNCAEIIRLFFLERKKDREIATQIGLTENTIKVKRSTNCMPYFKEKFKKHYKYPDLKY